MRISIIRYGGALGSTLGIALRNLFTRAWAAFVRLGLFVETWLTGTSKAQYGIAVARIGLGVTGFGLLASNWHTRFYTFGSGIAWSGERLRPVSDLAKIPLFSLFYRASMNDLALTGLYLVLFALSLLVILGYRMRITLPVFGILWVSFAGMTSFLGDQGDNIYRIALIAFLFADTSGRWSLDARLRTVFSTQYESRSWIWGAWHGRKIVPAWLRNLSHNLVVVVITAQVSFVYVSGALYKSSGATWSGGTAIYYPLHVDRFGTWPALSGIITAWAPVVALLTYGALLTQLSFPFLLMNRWTRKFGIVAISGVHIGIGLLMGLPWFSLTMIALDCMFVSDSTWTQIGMWCKNLLRGASERAAAVPRTSD
jgi:hypothetical protein